MISAAADCDRLAPVLVIGAFLLLRGCPMCWLLGLFQTIANRKARSPGEERSTGAQR